MSEKVRQEDAPKDERVEVPKLPDPQAAARPLARYAQYHGMFEVEAARAGRALFTPLLVPQDRANRVPGLDVFTEAYSVYKLPVHETSKAIGRVQDLLSGGAPRTPHEIKPATMRKFKPIDNVGNKISDEMKATDANAWIAQQNDLHSSFDRFMSTRISMGSALDGFHAAQEALRQRKLQMQKAEKTEKLHKITEAAETLAKITEVTKEALTFTAGFDSEFLSAEEEYTATAEDGVQTAEVKRKPNLRKLTEAAKKAGGAINLESIFIDLMGKRKEYKALTDGIQQLNKLLAESECNEQLDRINQSWKQLSEIKLEVKGEQRAFSAKRGDARNAAQAFGQAMGGRESTIMVTLMAEAYQELDLFGEQALTTGTTAVRKARPVHWWLNDETEKFKVEREEPFNDFASDFREIAGAVKDTYRSHEFLQEEAPKWREAATAWKHFLSDVMQKAFDPTDSDPDRRSGVYPGKA